MSKLNLIIITFSIFLMGSIIISSSGFILECKSSTINSNGNILYVGGIGPGNYSSIQDAIDNTSDGDTVYVYDDSSPYYEKIVVDKSINLIGENRDTTTINDGSITSIADNVVVSGFTIIGGSGIDIQSDYNIIKNNKIIFCYTGINIDYIADHTTITNNIIIHNKGAGIFDECRDSDNTITWNVIGGNGKNYPWYAGLYKHFSGGYYHHNDFSLNWQKNAFAEHSYWGFWNDSSEGNYWDNWKNNPGYPNTYIISGTVQDQIDYHPSPIPYFNYTIVCIDASYYAKVNSQIWFIPSINKDPLSVTWYWDFGDGNTSNEWIPKHSYSKPGTFNISVTVTDSKGQSDTDKSKAYIGVPPDNPNITGPTVCKPKEMCTYIIVANDSDGGMVRYYINWGDGSKYEIPFYPAGQTIPVSHYWTQKGKYTISVKTIDEANLESDYTYHEVLVHTTSKSVAYLMLCRFLERFPLFEKVLNL